MKINRNTALFMLVTNALLLIFIIVNYIYFQETLLHDFHQKARHISNGQVLLMFTIPGLLATICNIGLLWILYIFKERRWVRSSVIVFFVVKIIVIISIPISALISINAMSTVNRIDMIFEFVGFAYMLTAFFFVRRDVIRKYYIIFSIISIAIQCLTISGKFLFREFGKSWMLIEPNVVGYFPFLISLMLFAKVYKLSRSPSLPQSSPHVVNK